MPAKVMSTRVVCSQILALGLLLPIGGLVAVNPAASTTSPVRATPSASEAPGAELVALARARQSGRREEVPDARSESSSLYANPDGTLTLEDSVFPTRVRKAGGWVPIDRRLKPDPVGSISTNATTYDLHLAAGGSQPLVSLGTAGHEVALRWPGPLPSPVLEGESATYSEVLPGVDLVVRATDLGFAEVLVVKTLAAAANPALARISFAVATKGIILRPEPKGGFVGVDAKGATVFTGAQLLMWDSSGSPDGSGSRLRGPSSASRKAVIPTTVTADAVTLAPDWAVFRDPATTYPVYVDPSISIGKLAWAEVWKEIPNSTDINPGHEAMVGYENDPCCPPFSTVRAFWRMDSARVNGKHIISATFRTHEWWAWSCSARVVELWWTGSITSNLTWNTQSWIAKQTTANVAKRRGAANCPEGDVEFDLTGLTQKAANERWTDMTVGLKAANETDPFTWKKFDNNPVLVVNYNTVPDVPGGLTIDGRACGSGTVLGTLTPTMRAGVSDPDAGTVLDVSLYWAPVGSAINETDKVVQNAVASGSTAVMAIPAGRLTSQVTYYWQARVTDRVDTSALSAQCLFTVDITPPVQPAVSSPDYPSDGNFHGGVGRTGSFTLSANGSIDVTTYLYGWADPPTTPALPTATGGSVTITGTPGAQGLNTLYVRSKDVAGNLSSVRQYVFLAGGPTSPAANWLAQPGTGAALTDDSGNGYPANITGTTTRVPGRDGTANGAIDFGATGSAATSGPIVGTNSSFAVAAWVRLTSTANWATIAGQQGFVNSGMVLQYDKVTNRWAIANYAGDTNGATAVRAESTIAPQIGVWTHLVGTYDAGPGSLSLYVNGMLASSVSTRVTWRAGGPVLIGAEKLNGSVQNGLPGAVTDVRVWDRLVYPAEIRSIASASTPVGTWTLDYDNNDSSGYGHDLTPNGGISFGDGFNFLGGASLDGTGYLATNQPVVLTDQSFTVAAWVRLSVTPWNSTAVCQQGNRVCSFYLQYNITNDKWAFLTRSSDVDNAPGPIALSTSTPAVGAWTHLVGVYDAGAQRIRLYVNGQLESDVAAIVTTFNATGPLTIGQAKWNGGATDSWNGDIDDVRVYLGVLTDAQIVDLFNQ